MIFAKVDVTLGSHHRVLLIPSGIRAECVGVWTLAILWTRGHERDGFCPLEALDKVARGKIVDELVRVGLVSREVDEYGAHGFRILRYEEHNETKAQVDSRKAKDRFRKGKPIPDGIQSDSERIPLAGVVGIPGSDSGSGSGSGVLALRERVQGEGPERTVEPSDAITPELRAIAELALVQDIAGAWAKFCGHHAGKWVHVAGKWQMWCVTEAKRERVARDRANSVRPLQPTGPGGQRLWKVGGGAA